MISSFGRLSISFASTVELPVAWTPRTRGATSARSFALSGAFHSQCMVKFASNDAWSRPGMFATERTSVFMA